MRGQSGYTFVEVMLFLGITGALIMLVMSGFNSSIRSNRVTDTNRSFEANIQSQYTKVRTGVAERRTDTVCGAQNSAPGFSDTCLVMGRLLAFTRGADSNVRVYNIVSDMRPMSSCSATSGAWLLQCYRPRVLDLSVPLEEIRPQWNAELTDIAFQKGSTSSYSCMSSLALLRDPESEAVYVVPSDDLVPDVPGVYYIFNDPLSGAVHITETDTENYANAKGQIILKHDTNTGLKNYLIFNGGEGIGTVNIAANPITEAVCP